MLTVIKQFSYFPILLLQGSFLLSLTRSKLKINFQSIGLSLVLGIYIEYFIFLTGISFANHTIISIIVSLSTLTFFFFSKKLEFEFKRPKNLTVLFLILFYIFLFTLKILIPPADAHDTRFIWMFHAKMIFFGSGMDGLVHLTNEAYHFTHSSYPNLLPMLMARSAHFSGIWNEHLPKFGILVLFISTIVSIFALTKSVFLRLFLGLVLIGLPEKLIWNGYADGYLACFGVLGILYFTRWNKTKEFNDLLYAITLTFLLAYIKTEGTVLALLTIILFLIFNIKNIKKIKIISPLILIGFLPIFMWNHYKTKLEITSWLKIDIDLYHRVMTRLFSPDFLLIVEEYVFQLWRSLIIFFLTIIIYKKISRLKVEAKSLLFISFILISYNSILFGVYLGTPHDLNWHLATSIDRTLLFSNVLILSSLLFICSDFAITNDNNG